MIRNPFVFSEHWRPYRLQPTKEGKHRRFNWGNVGSFRKERRWRCFYQYQIHGSDIRVNYVKLANSTSTLSFCTCGIYEMGTIQIIVAFLCSTVQRWHSSTVIHLSDLTCMDILCWFAHILIVSGLNIKLMIQNLV